MGAPRRAAAPLARAGGHGLSPRGCQWHPKEGAGSEETVAEVHEEHVPGAPRRRGTAWPRGCGGAAGRRVAAEVDYQLCGGERAGRGRRGVRRGWGELAQHLRTRYQCNQSLGCRSCSSPSSDWCQQLRQTARSAGVAWPGPELQSRPSMPPLRPSWGSSVVTPHLLPEATLGSPRVPAKGFAPRRGQCPTRRSVKGKAEGHGGCPSHRHRQTPRDG